MHENIPIDQCGRLVLPKRLRKHFGLEAGGTLSVSLTADGIELRRAKRPALRRVNGVLVFSGGSEVGVGNDLASEAREARLDELTEGFREGR